jgi:hypothetical protein
MQVHRRQTCIATNWQNENNRFKQRIVLGVRTSAILILKPTADLPRPSGAANPQSVAV